MGARAYIDEVLAGDRRILSKTITLIESALPAHQEIARKVLDALPPRQPRSSG